MILETNASPGVSRVMEQISQWAGDGVRADVPSGPPATQLVETFERAMSGIDASAGAVEAVSQSGVENVYSQTVPQHSPVAGVSGSQPDIVVREKRLQELSGLLEKISRQGDNLSIGDLLAIQTGELHRVQHLLGMISVNLKSGFTTSQEITSTVENMLKQDG